MRHPVYFVALSATVLFVAACSNSEKSDSASSPDSTSQSASATSTPPEAPKVRIAGRVNSVMGSTVEVGAKSGPSKVAITPATRVLQISPAKFADVVDGDCVDIRRTDPSAPARLLTLSPAANGKCAQVIEDKIVRGMIAAVSGTTISVAASSESPVAIAVDQSSQFSKQAATSALVITEGACLTVVGTAGPGGGAMEAAAATVAPPATNGSCAVA